jgi:hypothetical protein
MVYKSKMSKLPDTTSAPVVVDPFEAVPSQMPTTATVVIQQPQSDPEEVSYRALFYTILILIIIGSISGGAYHYANRQ